MDLLDRVMAPATELLAHVDDVLSQHGAPPEHPVWASMRRVGSLPSGALVRVAALAPDDIGAGAAPIAVAARDCDMAVADVPPVLDGHGVAATAYATRWADVSDQIAGGRDGLAGRMTAAADYLRDIAEWAAETRRNLALQVGASIGSAEAVTVRGAIGGDIASDVIIAAADIATHALDSVAEAVEAGWQVRQRWAEVRVSVPVRATVPMTVELTGHIEAR